MSLRTEKIVVAAFLLVALRATFVMIGALVDHPGAPPPWLTTRLDTAIPVVPAAVWAYVSWYAAPALLFTAARFEFRRFAAATALAFVLCGLGYVLLPVSIVRPALSGNTASERVLLKLYAHDPPWNLFPSFHAALCWILSFLPTWRAPARRLMALWMATICAACMLTKQHYVLDVVAGLIVGGAAHLASSSLIAEPVDDAGERYVEAGSAQSPGAKHVANEPADPVRPRGHTVSELCPDAAHATPPIGDQLLSSSRRDGPWDGDR